MKQDIFKLPIGLLTVLFLIGMLSGCGTDDDPAPTEDPVASFQFEVSATDFHEVAFSNFSQNATSYSWDFGDGSAANTTESPTYAYADPGTYTVTLTASNDEGASHSIPKSVIITDPLEAERSLFGTDGKVWHLLADASTGVNTFQVGPSDRSQIWWSLGGVDELCVRECLFDDTWTFKPDGTYVFENNGDFWGEGGVWREDLVGCFDATNSANFVSATGADLSGWNSGTYNFDYDPTAGTITVTGGFIGLTKAGTSAEITEPASTVTYNVVKLVDADVDTVVLETSIDGGYWAATLVSYGETTNAVVVDECPAVTEVNVTFQLNYNDYTGTAVTPEVNGTFNDWCGNCNALSDDDGDGIWTTTLLLPVGDHEFKFSADSWGDQEMLTSGSECTITTGENTNRTLTVGMSDMTLNAVCWNSCDNCASNPVVGDITGKTWKVLNGPAGVRVGPGLGSGEWFTNDQVWADDNPCLFDDTFIFDAGGTYAVNIGAEMFTESFMTGIEANGCVEVASIPANLTDWTGGTFDFTFTEATDDNRATIAVTGSGAYVGFYKGANGAEYTEPAAGTITYEILSYTDGASRDVLELTVDISGAQDGTAYWTYKLIAE